MNDWRDDLPSITEAFADTDPIRSWDDLVADAEATTTLATALAARHRRHDGTIDTAALAVDVADIYEHDELRDEVFKAARHAMERTYGDMTDVQISERVLGMHEAQLTGLHSNLQGALLELRVEQLAQEGLLDLPEGATFHLNESYGTQGYDGVLEHADGTETLVQIKASGGSEIISRHLDKYPQYPTVFTNEEAARAASEAGLDETGDIIDVGVGLDDFTPGVDGLLDEVSTSMAETLADRLDDLPVLALGVVAAQSAWQVHRGADVRQEWSRVKQRSTSIGIWSALGWSVELATGSTGLRALTTVGGKGTFAMVRSVERSADRVASHGLSQIRADRRLLATISQDQR